MIPRSLLVVEDDPTTRRALQRYFQLKGWEVRVASTVAEGLKLLDPPPDCVILDLMLPDQGGEVVLRKIRKDQLPTRVAVCTGTSSQARLDHVAKLGPDALLIKPITVADLCVACGVN
ncbi:response regulator transcription factor [Tundrisphaera lichenicola]|uniref:response regulator transcription factor n=1 Tax=Tundrisphaera lichenicola TaxID=2029860 RepID=UPI003EBFD2DB